MIFDFNSIATNYSENLKKLPEEYITLIINNFRINNTSKILDLGCGSGLLTIPLSQYSINISGLDISHNMLNIAKAKNSEKNIIWIESDVSSYDFQENYYDLIISYESIHLFPNIRNVLQSCANSLKPEGAICMGWCFYNWERLLRNEIVMTFKNHGINWGEWSYQKFNKFNELINGNKVVGLTDTYSKYVEVYEEWTVIEIVKYITSISKAFLITDNEKKIIQKELMEKIIPKYGTQINGNTQFWIRYSIKR